MFIPGSKPTLSLHPDIYELFPRDESKYYHSCSAEHIGSSENDNYIEVQITTPGNSNTFRYSNRMPDSEKSKITYNITGTAGQFLMVSTRKSSSNSSCNIQEKITFLLYVTKEFDNGTIKCVLKDDLEEYSFDESRITVIPGKMITITFFKLKNVLK